MPRNRKTQYSASECTYIKPLKRLIAFGFWRSRTRKTQHISEVAKTILDYVQSQISHEPI